MKRTKQQQGLTKRGGIWWVDIRRKGLHIRESTGETSVRKAARRRDNLVAERSAERAPDGTYADFPCEEFWRQFEQYAEGRFSRRTLERYKLAWDQMMAFWGSPNLAGILKHQVPLFQQWLSKGGGRRKGQNNLTINNTCVQLRAIFGHAKKLGYFSGQNPFGRFPRLPVDDKEINFLSLEQRDELLERAKERGRDIHLIIAMGVFAGLRLNEILNARWSWVDFNKGCLVVQSESGGGFRTKRGRRRVVPLHDRLRKILGFYQGDENAFIVRPEKLREVHRHRYESKRTFRAVAEAAGVPWCTPHTLRHTFASHKVMAGVSLYKVAQWLGHSDTKTTAIYAHLAPQDDDINKE